MPMVRKMNLSRKMFEMHTSPHIAKFSCLAVHLPPWRAHVYKLNKMSQVYLVTFPRKCSGSIEPDLSVPVFRDAAEFGCNREQGPGQDDAVLGRRDADLRRWKRADQ
jgi:hypothetical protein